MCITSIGCLNKFNNCLSKRVVLLFFLQIFLLKQLELLLISIVNRYKLRACILIVKQIFGIVCHHMERFKVQLKRFPLFSLFSVICWIVKFRKQTVHHMCFNTYHPKLVKVLCISHKRVNLAFLLINIFRNNASSDWISSVL